MLAKDVMSQDVTTIAATAPIAEAARILINAQVPTLPVKDAGGGVIGILSEADLIRVLGASTSTVSSRDLTVQDVMTKEVVTADEGSSLPEIAKLMLDRRLRRIPILRDGRLVGVLRRSDLLKAMISTDTPSPEQSGQGRSAAIDLEMPADDELRRRVEAALAGDAFSSPWPPDVVALNGTIHVWGRALNHRMLESYREAATRVQGVKSVTMHMHVLGGR